MKNFFISNNMMHPFHLVSFSPWPIMVSINIMNLAISASWLFTMNNWSPFMISLTSLMISIFQWWRDVIRESSFQGFHSTWVHKGLKVGMILFIISEIMFFISFFWMLLHMALAPSMEIGCLWPPNNILTFNPYSVPLLNTSILISSGISVTWSHHSMLNSLKYESVVSLLITILLGIYFSFIQYMEYWTSSFTIADSVFGSSFFVMTGFHGIHVLIGSMMLMVCWIRLLLNHFSSIHHFGFEAAAWYWHFVDVVWLFLYVLIYWWSY
uniref:Cytochrome c oxidase subunit 3 n=1 Tax=Orussus occidentalis TaxID=576952 RepID=C4NCE8_ORUOC|nr:cytochrome c oxidase subunit III [Orussus occidentalis]ACJ69699.1 cytochrome c oxidase subunit III [Orussus occidentalis]